MMYVRQVPQDGQARSWGLCVDNRASKLRIGRKRRHKNVFSCKFFVKLPRKRIFSAVNGEYGKIIDVVWRKLCLLSV